MNIDDIFIKRRDKIIKHKKTRYAAGLIVKQNNRTLSQFSSREISKGLTPTMLGEPDY